LRKVTIFFIIYSVICSLNKKDSKKRRLIIGKTLSIGKTPKFYALKMFILNIVF